MSEGAVQQELNKLQSYSICGAVLPHSNAIRERQRHPSPDQHVMMNNSICRNIQVQTEDPQAAIETMVMVETPKIEREVVQKP